MVDSRGDWKASPENLNHAQTVCKSCNDSGTLYRDGLGMIASENIVSPMVQKSFPVTFMEGMQKVCLTSDITKVVAILIPSKSWELILQKNCSMFLSQIFNRLAELFPTLQH